MEQAAITMDESFLALLACPACGGDLASHGDNLACVGCDVDYPVHNGVPNFAIDGDYYFGEISRDAMKSVLAGSAEKGARKSVLAVCEEMGLPFGTGYAIDESRAVMLLLSGLWRGARVLDLGAGWGNFSLVAVRLGMEVVAMDLAALRIGFVQQVSREDGLNALRCVQGGDTARLPFRAGSFDLILLNGVLEWVPESIEGDPRDVQVNYLRELRGLLTEAGQLAVGIENRWGYGYLMGRREDHTGLRFGALFPRRISDLYSRFARRKPYRTYTYGDRDYQRLFADAGFPDTQIFGCRPNYRFPAVIARQESDDAVKRFYGSRRRFAVLGRVVGAFQATGLLKHTMPSYMIRAGKTLLGEGLLQAQLGEELGEKVEFERGYLGNFGAWTAIFRGKSTAHTIRTGFNELSRERIADNWRRLQILQDKGGKLVPLPVVDFQIGELPIYVESCLPGNTNSDFGIRTGIDGFDRARNALQDLRALFPSRQANPSDWTTAVDGRCRFLIDNLDLDETWLKAMTDRLKQEPPSSQFMALGLVHGDFHPGNLLTDNQGGIRGIIDWDLSSDEGFCFLDDAKYHVILWATVMRRSWHACVLNVFHWESGSKQDRALRRRLSDVGIDPMMLAFFALEETCLLLRKGSSEGKSRRQVLTSFCNELAKVLLTKLA